VAGFCCELLFLCPTHGGTICMVVLGLLAAAAAQRRGGRARGQQRARATDPWCVLWLLVLCACAVGCWVACAVLLCCGKARESCGACGTSSKSTSHASHTHTHTHTRVPVAPACVVSCAAACAQPVVQPVVVLITGATHHSGQHQRDARPPSCRAAQCSCPLCCCTQAHEACPHAPNPHTCTSAEQIPHCC
jgi:hypothetical protein